MNISPRNAIDVLVTRAEAAEMGGATQEADLLWREIALKAPGHARLLVRQARRQTIARDFVGALDTLARAAATNPQDPEIFLEEALTLRVMGNLPRALESVSTALTLDPYHFLALLAKGSIHEQMGRIRAAAKIYRDVLRIAPPLERLPPALRSAMEHAKDVVVRNAEAIAQHLRLETQGLRAQFSGQNLKRFDEGLEVFAGTKKRFVHEPILFDFPQLPALTFYDRSYFPWAEKLEAATPIFQAELEKVMREDWERFNPYIQLPAGAPVNQWTALNRSPDWSTFFLWRDGTRNDDGCRRCPQSAAALESLPLAHQPGFGPTAMFSVLQPRTNMPAHTGSTNVRLICHLPLILPGNCRFRVGNDVREWRMGESFVFDDSIEHEAWNDSGQVRVVLIFDVWNPLLTEAERSLVAAMMNARNSFYGAET